MKIEITADELYSLQAHVPEASPLGGVVAAMMRARPRADQVLVTDGEALDALTELLRTSGFPDGDEARHARAAARRVLKKYNRQVPE